MRAFVAIDRPPLQEPVAPGLRPEDHLTLHFFEDLPAEQIPDVVSALTTVAGTTGPFDLEIRGVGAFPSLHRPRVIWAGVGDGLGPLQTLAARLRQELLDRRFSVESRPFVPHLTLARIRSARDAAWAGPFLVDPVNADRVWGRGSVTELLLKESELLPSGARHTVRARVPLVREPPTSPTT
jgi:RNA 2',3'-cyclic 3'-phosphodiesterase